MIGADARFKPGDLVRIQHASQAKVWTVLREETAAWEQERAYALSDGRRIRYASESRLHPAEASA